MNSKENKTNSKIISETNESNLSLCYWQGPPQRLGRYSCHGGAWCLESSRKSSTNRFGAETIALPSESCRLFQSQETCMQFKQGKTKIAATIYIVNINWTQLNVYIELWLRLSDSSRRLLFHHQLRYQSNHDFEFQKMEIPSRRMGESLSPC